MELLDARIMSQMRFIVDIGIKTSLAAAIVFGLFGLCTIAPIVLLIQNHTDDIFSIFLALPSVILTDMQYACAEQISQLEAMFDDPSTFARLTGDISLSQFLRRPPSSEPGGETGKPAGERSGDMQQEYDIMGAGMDKPLMTLRDAPAPLGALASTAQAADGLSSPSAGGKPHPHHLAGDSAGGSGGSPTLARPSLYARTRSLWGVTGETPAPPGASTALGAQAGSAATRAGSLAEFGRSGTLRSLTGSPAGFAASASSTPDSGVAVGAGSTAGAGASPRLPTPPLSTMGSFVHLAHKTMSTLRAGSEKSLQFASSSSVTMTRRHLHHSFCRLQIKLLLRFIWPLLAILVFYGSVYLLASSQLGTIDLISDTARRLGCARMNILMPNYALRALFAEGAAPGLSTALPEGGIPLPPLPEDLADPDGATLLMLATAGWPGSSPAWSSGACSLQALSELTDATTAAVALQLQSLDDLVYGIFQPRPGQLMTPALTSMEPGLTGLFFKSACGLSSGETLE